MLTLSPIGTQSTILSRRAQSLRASVVSTRYGGTPQEKSDASLASYARPSARRRLSPSKLKNAKTAAGERQDTTST